MSRRSIRRPLHGCPTPGCSGERERWQAMCGTCFRRLPQDLRGRIDAARAQKAPHRIAAAAMAATDWLVAHAPGAAIARVVGERPG